MLAPRRQRVTFLRLQCAAVVDPGNSALVAGDVFEQRFDHMRCHVKLAHGGGCGAAQIVMGKTRDRRTEPPVECSLAHAPASQRPVGAPTEYEFTVPARTAVENGTHLSGYRNDMLPFVFGP